LTGYALMVGLVAVVAVAAVTGTGTSVRGLFDTVSEDIDVAQPGGGGDGDEDEGEEAGNTAPAYSGGAVSVPGLTQGEAMTPVDVSGFSDADSDSLTFTPLGSWPPGLTLTHVSDSTARISGTPSGSGGFTGLAIRADDGEDTVDTPLFTITVAAPPGPCTGSPSPGDVCPDGTIYAGLTPDGNVPMYITRCDAGNVYNTGAGSCECDPGTVEISPAAQLSGSPNGGCGAAYTQYGQPATVVDRSGLSWHDGSENYPDSPLDNCVSPFTDPSCRTGEANTALLAGLSDSVSPYRAAQYCDSLTLHGHSDWYLPARDELHVIRQQVYYPGGPSAAGFSGSPNMPKQRYWSSSEDGGVSGIGETFPDPTVQTDTVKTWVLSVRCARK
jgi:Flp pilus assembly pilin Flp